MNRYILIICVLSLFALGFISGFHNHIIPSFDNTYDLGSHLYEWRNLYLNGKAYIDNLEVDGSAKINDLEVNTSIQGAFPNTIYISGIERVDADTVRIKAGTYGICNNNFFYISTDTDVDITTPTGEDFYYLYIDDDVSSYPIPTFYFSTTEPARSNDYINGKIGLYNGNDRCIGAVWVNSSNEIYDFKYIKGIFIYTDYYKQILSNGAPDGNWTLLDASSYLPVGTCEIYISASNDESDDDSITVALRPYNCLFSHYEYSRQTYILLTINGMKMPDESERKIEWKGEDDDNDTFNIYLNGYKIRID